MGTLIPINDIKIRKIHKQKSLISNYNHYPLYKSYKNNYNFKNVIESLLAWDKYSNSVGNNLKQVIRLAQFVSENDCNSNHIREISNIINSNIIQYLESGAFFRELVSDIKNKSELNQTAISILNNLENGLINIINCDRVLQNYETISKRFNLFKLVEKDLSYDDDYTDTIYKICNLLDTYNRSLKESFCITTELILYTFNIYDNKINQEEIIKNIIDYYLISYAENFEYFIENIQKASNASPFIDLNIVNKYLEYLKIVQNKMIISGFDNIDTTDKDLLSIYNSDLSLDESCKILKNGLSSLNEFGDFIEKAKEIITKVKLAPTKTINTVKEAIRALIVPTRLEDIKKGTHNALSLIFYSALVAPFIPIGSIGILFGIITSFTISKCINKKYLKDSIEEWNSHKNSIEKKIKETDEPDKKRELEKYLEEVNENINILTKRYESIRDKTTDEIKNSNDKKKENNTIKKTNSSSAFVSPTGKILFFGSNHNNSNSNFKKKQEEDEINDYINKIRNE